ncbi:MAG: S9 family peptidase, partial [Chloroflexota bacterium]|nr:S9 family peptidase [Chloroflexota bacterium]
WLVPLAGSEPRRLTSGKHRDGQPRWSPDGATLSFTSDRKLDDDLKGQIWTIAVAGGESTRLTSLAEGIEEFSWSPDGRSIAAVSKVRVGAHNPELDVRVIRTPRFRFDGEGFLDDKHRQIFVIDANSGNARQLTDGAFEHQHPAWSPTGHEIAFDSNRETGWELSPYRDIYAVRLAGKGIRRITDGSGEWSSPTWSPDGTTLACYGTRRVMSDSARSELFTVAAGGGAPISLTDHIDRNLRDGATADLVTFPGRPPLWDANGRSVSLVFSEQGQVHLARISIPDGEMHELTSGRRRIGGIALVPGGGYVYMANTATTPPEIFACDKDGRNERQLTQHNAEWLAGVEIAEPEPFWVASADGRQIHGWIMKPVGFEAGKKYPLVLEIHGGPFGMYGETMMHEFQLLAARGYVVVATNPRGSTGYGDDFAGQLFRAWGKHDFPDLMAAVDWAIEQGYVDEARMGVTGGSYGGFMTNWVIGHTDRFAAAVTGRCVSNMYSTFGTDDIFFASAEQTIGALPWEEPDIYWELSPISYVDRIETPLLIEHQEQDYRCPVEQAEQMFTALKRRDKTVEFIRFPDESHGMSRTGQPRHRIERLKYITDWFDRYL